VDKRGVAVSFENKKYFAVLSASYDEKNISALNTRKIVLVLPAAVNPTGMSGLIVFSSFFHIICFLYFTHIN
jgi:hypothetical protein